MLLRNILIAFISTVFTLLCLEGLTRVFWRDPNARELAKMQDGRELILRESKEPDLVYELTPGASAWAWNTNVKINSHGFRGPEIDIDKGDRYRIVVVGDSVTFGNELPEGAPFPNQLGRLLNRDELGYEVLNFALGGYDVLQEVATVEHKALIFKPDLVVVGFCLNDVGILSLNHDYLMTLTAYRDNVLYESHLARFLFQRFIRARLARDMILANELSFFRMNFKDRIDPIGEDEELRKLMADVGDEFPSDMYDDEPRIGRLRYAFRKLSEVARQEGFDVVVVIIPWLFGNHRGAHDVVAHEAQRVGFDVLDLTDTFLEYRWEALRMTPYDPIHPNQLGHQLIAEALRSYVAARTAR